MTPQEPRHFPPSDADDTNTEVLMNLVSVAGSIGQKTALGAFIVCGVVSTNCYLRIKKVLCGFWFEWYPCLKIVKTYKIVM